jgi:hypothetical protein
MNVPTHYAEVSRGFWSTFHSDLPAATEMILPFASDRYHESVHVAELALAQSPTKDLARHVNWYFGAHAAAYIGIFEAAKHDIERAFSHLAFPDTPLYKEMKATSRTKETLCKDPLNASQLYRALRNLRVHFGRPMVVLEVRPLVADRPHWYIQDLDRLRTIFCVKPFSVMTNLIGITVTCKPKPSWTFSDAC